MFKNLKKKKKQKPRWTHGTSQTTAAGDPKRQNLYKLLNRTNFALVCFSDWVVEKKKKRYFLGLKWV